VISRSNSTITYPKATARRIKDISMRALLTISNTLLSRESANQVGNPAEHASLKEGSRLSKNPVIIP
jgi:hypothetical protein